MNSFDDAFLELMGSEGNYSNHPQDPGGETMYGITIQVARDNGYLGEMKDLPLSVAKAIAKKCYWDIYQCDQYSPKLSFQIFDCAYNGGHPAEWLQQAAGVTIDGHIGAKTIAAIRSSDQSQLILRFLSYRVSYLTSLKIWPSFGKGWMNRIAKNLLLAAK